MSTELEMAGEDPRKVEGAPKRPLIGAAYQLAGHRYIYRPIRPAG